MGAVSDSLTPGVDLQDPICSSQHVHDVLSITQVCYCDQFLQVQVFLSYATPKIIGLSWATGI